MSKGSHLGNKTIKNKLSSAVHCDAGNIIAHSCHILTLRLPVGMVDVNVIGAMGVVAHNCTLLASVLMSFFHSMRVPVCPVDPVLK